MSAPRTVKMTNGTQTDLACGEKSQNEDLPVIPSKENDKKQNKMIFWQTNVSSNSQKRSSPWFETKN